MLCQEVLWDAAEQKLDDFSFIDYYTLIYLDPYYICYKVYIVFFEKLDDLKEYFVKPAEEKVSISVKKGKQKK
jgi:hypothetical protein